MSGVVCTHQYAKAKDGAREVKEDAPLQHKEPQAHPQDAVGPPMHATE